MRVLVSLPISHPEYQSIDAVIDGMAACSGTTGSIIRLADMLATAGIDVYLSAASESQSAKFPCIQHKSVDATQFDHLIVHQTHWNGSTLTFGNLALAKTFLWFQNQTSWAFVHTFLQKGGKQVICPSIYHASRYRAVPQWREKVKVIYNSYCPVFSPTVAQPQPRLLFIGAITPSKGFVELMQIWSYLAKQQVNLQLALAGSISIHKDSGLQVGSLGVAETDFETEYIQPWLNSLSESYQPQFLGALSPMELRQEIAQSWAAIVNPGWGALETFCVAAVEAQACSRTVFSVAAGGLKETVYQNGFQSLTQERTIKAVGDRILDGLSKMEAVEENGQLAGEFVRSKFSQQSICDTWVRVLSSVDTEPVLPKSWNSSRDFLCDLMRWTGTGIFIENKLMKRI